MPESPDLEQLAAGLVTLFTYGLITDDQRNGMTREIARELRLIWNARGAADIAHLDELMGGAFEINVARILKALDR